jgi:Zn-dependent protease
MTAVFYILIVLFSVVIHEVSHGYVAYILGDQTAKMQGRLTLNPLVHLDPFGSIILPALLYFAQAPIIGWAKPVPYNPYNLQAGKWGPALVAAAGPASNLLIAAVFGLVIRLNAVMSFAPAVFNELSYVIVAVNVLLAIFNLVPVPPLDGSKVLFSALPYNFRQVQFFLERYGFFLIIFVLLFGGNIVLAIEQYVVRILSGT